MEEMHRAWYTGRGLERPCSLSVSLCPSVHQPRSSPYRVLLDNYGSFITYAWLFKSLPIGDWSVSSTSVLPVVGWFYPALTWAAFKNEPHKHKGWHFYSITGNSKDFGRSMPGIESKTKYIFLIIICNITYPYLFDHYVLEEQSV